VSSDAVTKVEAVATMSNSSTPSAASGTAPAGDEAGRSAQQKSTHHSAVLSPTTLQSIVPYLDLPVVGARAG
jgi:hypothetical protein